ncbi:hypothetical protein PACID_00440 [Acidipropionibacterium acidipropionici ATCC 4875]|uniref:Uncharacterized protein n=1 Tax=Acidipropionibacterium acidipropionici (strain ATCC 4875 / DSM 20272 / JCM 6432 / NBRC 12425 / NCIMB 8070 / 4) TaxID=1171373 RepID=K7SF42_ACIA4|nr:hypothetical protein PACID_00440 [Acidipropionibacterium acidipropionici ATCC 4875]
MEWPLVSVDGGVGIVSDLCEWMVALSTSAVSVHSGGGVLLPE